MSSITRWARHHRLAAFFGLAFLITWWSWPLQALGLFPLAHWPWGPLIAAPVVIGITEGRAGYRAWARRLLRWRVGWRWWLVALGTPLAVLAVAAAANAVVWGAPAPVVATMAWSSTALLFAIRFVDPLDGPLGEEPGFRAFAVPELQVTRSPLRSAVVLGAIVSVWHAPLVATGQLAAIGFVTTFVITIVYVWLFNRTGGSALLTMVFHVAQGTVTYAALGFTGADAARMDWIVMVLWSALAAGLVVLDRPAWRTAPPAAIASVPAEPALR